MKLLMRLMIITLFFFQGCELLTHILSEQKEQNNTASKVWTWTSGTGIINQNGIYSNQQNSNTSDYPGARYFSASCTDKSGNFWLFGGYGYDGEGNTGLLNDLWKYDYKFWSCKSGSNIINQKGDYGVQNQANDSSMPGARYESIVWADNNGDLWLSGGFGINKEGNKALLNDLWKFDGKNWIWISGSDTGNQKGIYGTQNVPSYINMPGSRYSATDWFDNKGNLWLFGGIGIDENDSTGLLNDLWKFDGKYWTWISGSRIVNHKGSYGSIGTADSSNVPRSRCDGIKWIDSGNNLWLFGGYNFYLYDGIGYLNDLWKFDGKNWIWFSGSSSGNLNGIYGVKGKPDLNNYPGGRYLSTGWIDKKDNLWLFGGEGLDINDTESGYLGDLWKFDGKYWTWISGSSKLMQIANYGLKGLPDNENYPGARKYCIGWNDNAGNFWLFGGSGYDINSNIGSLNDLWKYKP